MLPRNLAPPSARGAAWATDISPARAKSDNFIAVFIYSPVDSCYPSLDQIYLENDSIHIPVWNIPLIICPYVCLITFTKKKALFCENSLLYDNFTEKSEFSTYICIREYGAECKNTKKEPLC
jgi:hypothetical protein